MRVCGGLREHNLLETSSSVAATGWDADYVLIIKSKTDPENGAKI